MEIKTIDFDEYLSNKSDAFKKEINKEYKILKKKFKKINIEPFCRNCEMNCSQRCFKIYGKGDGNPCEDWKLQKSIVFHSKVLRTSYKQRNRLFIKHLRVVCDSELDCWGEASGCSYDMTNIEKEMGTECERCCVVCRNDGCLKGKFNPALDKIIK